MSVVSFALAVVFINEYDLRILSSVFLIEMFDLWGNELKYAKEIASASLQKTRTKFYEVAGYVWVDLKL